jgi:hypothetical protein
MATGHTKEDTQIPRDSGPPAIAKGRRFSRMVVCSSWWSLVPVAKSERGSKVVAEDGKSRTSDNQQPFLSFRHTKNI